MIHEKPIRKALGPHNDDAEPVVYLVAGLVAENEKLENKEARYWWRIAMANGRRIAKRKTALSNQRLFMELFGTGMSTARGRCIEMGLDPDDNKSGLMDSVKEPTT